MKSEISFSVNFNKLLLLRRVAYWQQNVISCPVITDPQDGGWSDWGRWDQVLIYLSI